MFKTQQDYGEKIHLQYKNKIILLLSLIKIRFLDISLLHKNDYAFLSPQTAKLYIQWTYLNQTELLPYFQLEQDK